MDKNRCYLCIDLKSFFASVECVERHLDSLTTKLVVADKSRGDGTICLAVSPALKELGVRNRCRLFEVPKNIEFIIAKPRMSKYIEYSANIYAIYLRYVSKEDILVYSIDECFLDVTSYLKMYKKDAIELAKMIIADVIKETGICATAGIGTNLFLAKVALDITAKHSKDHIGYLDENIFKETIWYHKPITDIWNIGPGIARRLERLGATCLYEVSKLDPFIIKKEFGINGEYLLDHSNGIEPTTIKEIHEYTNKSHSISNGQVLFEDYNFDDALLVTKEMVDVGILDLVDKNLVTNGVSLYVGYSKDAKKPVAVSLKLNSYTSLVDHIMPVFIDMYNKYVDRNTPIRRISIGFNNVIDSLYEQYDLFTNINKASKEKKMQQTILEIKEKYGKNSILKGMNLKEKATQVKRNTLIGGHNAK